MKTRMGTVMLGSVSMILLNFLATEVALSSEPTVEWEKTFGGSDDDRGSCVQQTADGGYIIVGATGYIYTRSYDVYLIKTDSAGNGQWEKTFGGSRFEWGSYVQQTSDGGYVIAGQTDSFGAGSTDAYLIKTDSAGNTEWEKTFGGSRFDSAQDVRQTADGGYIIVGQADSFGEPHGDAYLIKTDSAGNLLWQKTFGTPNVDYGHSVQQTADGGYIIAGHTYPFGEPHGDAYLIKTDSTGNLQWENTFGASGNDFGWSVDQTTDGGYIITGGTSPSGVSPRHVYLIKTDSAGDSEWEKTFVGGSDQTGYCVQQTTDGGYIIAGATNSFGSGSWDVYLIKTNSAGNGEWEKTFGGTGDQGGSSVQQTTDGGYVIVGYTWPSGGGNIDVYLLKVGDGLVAYYPFNGNADDESGNENHGMVHGATLTTDRCGNPDSAYSFDGVDDYIDMGTGTAPTDLRITGPLTVGSWFWAEPEALLSDMLIVSRTGRDVHHHWCWKLGLLYSIPWASISQNGYSEVSATGPGPVNSRVWHHIAMTYEPDEFIKVYLDGGLVGQVLGDAVPDYINDPSGVPVFVGAFYQQGLPPGHLFPGKIDEVRIYNYALSKDEIADLITNCPPVANAGSDQVAECACLTPEGTQVTLDGSSSYDPDEDPLTYEWTGPFVGSAASGPDPTVTLVDGCPGHYSITLIVNDGYEDSDPDEVLVTVQDTTPPAITCPADVTLECPADTDPASTGTATATDNCTPEPVIDYMGVSDGMCPEAIERTWVATDASGNVSTCTQVITIQDTTPPVFTTVPQDMTVECDGSGNSAELSTWLASAAASDLCGSVTLSNDFTGLSDGCGATGSATVTWTAVDECGNMATASATFAIVDTTPPVVTCPGDVVLECPADTSPSATGEATGSDACGSVTITHSDVSVPGCGNTETITRTWTATDECGNSSSCEQTITVADTKPPEFTTVPEDKVVQRDGNGNLTELDSWLASVVKADDACGNVTISNDFSAFPYECGHTGSVTVTWTAEDECGGTATTSATFTIEDPTAGVTYEGDLLLSTGGAPTVSANLIAMLRDDAGNLPDIDGEEVTFTLVAEGLGTIEETAYSVNGLASAVMPLEPAIYMITVTLGCSDLTASAILVVYNPEGGFATGGGWILPPSDGLNTHPDVRGNFGFNARYKKGDPTGHIEFRYSDGLVDLKSTSIEQLVITGGKIAQFKGFASVNGEEGNWFFAKAIDNGEPGIYSDTFLIKIWYPGYNTDSDEDAEPSPDADPDEIAGGVLQGGNIVVHTRKK